MITENITLDRKSITKVLRQLQKYRERLPEAIEEAMEFVCQVAADLANATYGGAGANVTFSKVSDHEYEILAEGDRVCFLEFGTGYLVDESHPFAGNLSIDIEPGSWSSWHANTFERYDEDVQAGEADPNDYPYNREPRRGMLQAYDYIKENLASEVAKRLENR